MRLCQAQKEFLAAWDDKDLKAGLSPLMRLCKSLTRLFWSYPKDCIQFSMLLQANYLRPRSVSLKRFNIWHLMGATCSDPDRFQLHLVPPFHQECGVLRYEDVGCIILQLRARPCYFAMLLETGELRVLAEDDSQAAWMIQEMRRLTHRTFRQQS